MSDLGADYAEKRIRELERALDRLYSDAQKEIEKKTDDFFRRSAAREKQKLAQVKSGKMTQEAFDKWKSGQVFIGKQWTEKERQMADTLAKYNQIALDLVDGKKFSVFAFNANYAAYYFEHDAGVGFGFGLYDSATVARMVADKPNILPFKKLDKKKDERWNWKNIRAQVTQGVVQGESIPQIAKRMQAVTGKNKTQATLYARTAMTSAQNGGRQARYEEAEALGIKFKKVWLATLDGHTRDLHADLDGVAVEPDEDFGYGKYAVEYPGDPYGLPEMVYNCRCTMITELKDYPNKYSERRARGDDGKTYVIENMTYKEWEASKKVAEQKENVALSNPESILSNTLKDAYSYHRSANDLKSVSAEDFIESSQRLQQKNPFDPNLENLDDASKEHIASTLSTLCESYDTPLNYVRVMTSQESLGNSAFASTRHNYETGTAEIIINPVKSGNFEKTVARMKELRDKGYMPRGVRDDDLGDYVMTHEFGHSLIEMQSPLNKNRNFVNENYDKIRSARKEIATLYDQYSKEVGRLEELRKKEEFDFIMNLNTDARDRAKEYQSQINKIKISSYSLTNADEFVAEGFAASRFNATDSPYAESLMTIIDKYFRR